MTDERLLYPLHVFRFHVDFRDDPIDGQPGETNLSVCSGAFSECSGLEATMEPKVIKVGGRNYGAVQRPGPVTFATVILKRGMTSTRDLWTWFQLVNRESKYGYRLAAFINMYDTSGEAVLAIKLEKALPIKFKAADMNARGTEVGVEELHIAHEGLSLLAAGDATTPSLRQGQG
jgi:phage tail-like protein